ncbi:helix-turn-helix transcriptional regulator [Mucilaginibacter rubeus]|uniref:Helix-turn-helix transcriptional regulator n=1 Tax=Mucilaginibacter rubeus TaxID=2027860 RepID=A0AAE6MK83_9SPHI|nr:MULTISPECIES: helix-turn-helix domain-containing protein [Mucilaginibacter]QEM06483.1 helix-turn-helix transcriptional regulator [Mucilaginibacter rubeus]QEM19069.1 helix-turn-helix transcriptional regulator [Mucilaginibacter gossypii]QTE44389.1 helix-turn-helix transcriptional regulator [Mucilaginibacter rubeus]QTE50988.1 helix-turn-helix transcriptional regulator [Mucilaginibacter rubeus]QTE56072.1 helix-turn-helix transcriptional regulator [Mucilaginibacter rubeus]
MKVVEHRSNCPIAYSLNFISDRWVLLILRDLVFTDKSTYGDFLASEEKIATNVLADRLNLLEEHGFIESTVSEEKKNKFIYSLTEKGIDLIPAIAELMVWGSKYNPPGAVDIVKELSDDREGAIQRYKNKARARMKQAAQA